MSAGGPDREALAELLREHTGAARVVVTRVERLGGGAIQENWAVDVTLEGGERPGLHELVLRTSAPSGVPTSHDRAREFAALRAAHAAGVTCPEPWFLDPAGTIAGRDAYLMRRHAGEARGPRLVRDPLVLERGDALAERLGREMARLHRVRPPRSDLAFLDIPSGPVGLARVAWYRRLLDGLGRPFPVLEWALRRLEVTAPPAGPLVLCHMDLRTGNFLVEHGELTAILDWEFAIWGDRHEDLGWLLCRSWRFGNPSREVGGIGSRAALLRGYAAEAGSAVDEAALPWWEAMATLRWAVIALLQAERHLSGAERSLELALTAHVVPELERDLLDQLAGA